MNNNGGNKEQSTDSYCYFHPKEHLIGVCPLCLHERLIVLLAATKQRRQYLSSSSSSVPGSSVFPRHKKKPSILFSLGSLLINRLEFRHQRACDDRDCNPDCEFGFDGGDYDDFDVDFDDDAGVEDSFISIQFQNNGVASWEKDVGLISDEKNRENSETNKKKSSHSKNQSKETIITSCLSKAKATKSIHLKEGELSMVEHAKPRGGPLRWRKRIGHMFHLVRWKRSASKASGCHVGSKVEGVKVRSSMGWNLRTLTKRRSTREQL
ncbi:hypothetical protein LINPERPRIM_LOCUS4590 [Linum perenne]